MPRQSWLLRSPSVAQAEPERFGYDAEDLGVVHLPANTVAAGSYRGQDHVLAGMHVGIDHRRQVAEAQYGTGNVLVALVRHVGAGLLAGHGRIVGVVELRSKRLIMVRQAR